LVSVDNVCAITRGMSVAPETKNVAVIIQTSCIRRPAVWTGHVPDELTGHRSQFNGIFAKDVHLIPSLSHQAAYVVFDFLEILL